MSAFRSQGERMVWASRFTDGYSDTAAADAVMALRGSPVSATAEQAVAMLAEMRGKGGAPSLGESLDAYGAPAGETEQDRLRAWQQRERRLRAALEAVEWGALNPVEDDVCPYCVTRKPSHTDDCIVGQALGR